MLKSFSLPPDLSPGLRSNFINLFWDIAWWGLYIGSTTAFLSIYAARCGATPGQIGLLAAIPALTSLLLSLPAGRWLRHFPAGKATVWSAFGSRILFLLYVFLPWIIPFEFQVEALIILAVVIALPTTIINISFSQFFVEAVPIEWRSLVVGTRMALMSLISFVVTLLCGVILARLPFPAGYQVVFLIGFFGAILTVPVLCRVHPAVVHQVAEEPAPECRVISPKSSSSVIRLQSWVVPPLTPSGLYFLRVVFILFCFNMTNNMIAPLIPDLLVNTLEFPDSLISLATALSTLLVFLVSLFMSRLGGKFGSRRATAFGAILLAVNSVLLAWVSSASGYLLVMAVGGLASGVLACAQYNYHLDAIPPSDQPAWLSWSLLLGSLAVLVGSLAGPILARFTSIPAALMILGAARLLVGLMIWLRG
jgi:MFS family permease